MTVYSRPANMKEAKNITNWNASGATPINSFGRFKLE
jgi:hypothetical protein